MRGKYIFKTVRFSILPRLLSIGKSFVKSALSSPLVNARNISLEIVSLPLFQYISVREKQRVVLFGAGMIYCADCDCICKTSLTRHQFLFNYDYNLSKLTSRKCHIKLTYTPVFTICTPSNLPCFFRFYLNVSTRQIFT